MFYYEFVGEEVEDFEEVEIIKILGEIVKKHFPYFSRITINVVRNYLNEDILKGANLFVTAVGPSGHKFGGRFINFSSCDSSPFSMNLDIELEDIKFVNLLFGSFMKENDLI